MHDMNWVTISHAGYVDDGHIAAKARIEPDASWFDGHFPGNPVLPGIAQLAIVLDAVRKAGGKDMEVCGFRRVRFRQVIQPDDDLEISVSPNEKDGTYAFNIRANGEPACKGTMVARPAMVIGDR